MYECLYGCETVRDLEHLLPGVDAAEALARAPLLLNVDLETASMKLKMAQDFFSVCGDVIEVLKRNPNLLSYSYGRYMGRLGHLKEQGVDPYTVKLPSVISVTADKFEIRYPGYLSFLHRSIPAEEDWAILDDSSNSSSGGKGAGMSVFKEGGSVKLLETRYNALVQRRIRRQYANAIRIETNTPS